MTGATSWVRSFAEQPDGRLLMGGFFGGVNGVSEDPPRAPVALGVADDHGAAGGPGLLRRLLCGLPRGDQRFGRCSTPGAKGGVPLVDGGNVSGATTDTLTLSGVSVADVASYDVVISNVVGNVTSDTADLTVAALPLCRAGVCDPIAGCMLECSCLTAPDGDGDGLRRRERRRLPVRPHRAARLRDERRRLR